MAKNYMADVAKLLGIELEEEFMVTGDDSIYKLTKDGLEYKSDDGNWYYANDVFLNLLDGTIEIVKLPWQPDVGITADLIVDEAPTVEERKRGHWFDPEDDDGRTAWHCSVCDYVVKTIGFYPNYNYCPCCGARMDKGVRK